MTGTACIVVGTRPEAIKLAPVVSALRRGRVLHPVLVSTGQHRQMLDQALGVFGLKPDVDLSVMQPGQTLYEVTSRTLEGMRGVIRQVAPEWVVVQGDTTTTFAAALAAFYERTPVAHVEAGLRSGDPYAPFPEEMNRRLVDQLSRVLFAPTAQARDLLFRDGFATDAVHHTGNTVVDALLATRELLRGRRVDVPGIEEEMLQGMRVLLVTAHRRESFGAPLEGICRALAAVARADPSVLVIYPVHLNPNVDRPVRRILGNVPRVALLPPVSYLQFITLMDRAHIVLTDSGGVQEEAPTFKKPLLVLRDNTERPEGVAAGVARLVGTNEERIFAETMILLQDADRYRAMSSGVNPYGDGRAAQRIAAVLSHRAPAEDAAGVPNTAVA